MGEEKMKLCKVCMNRVKKSVDRTFDLQYQAYLIMLVEDSEIVKKGECEVCSIK